MLYFANVGGCSVELIGVRYLAASAGFSVSTAPSFLSAERNWGAIFAF